MQSTTPTLYRSDAEQLEALRVPFPITEVKKRDQGGTELKYYEGYTIQQRLLDVLGTGLSIETGKVIATDSNINVETILKIEWMSGRKTTTSGWGSADILIGKSGKMVNDPYKSAATDSIKVAATKLGVAAELYDSKYREGLDVRLKELVEQEAEKAFLTCQCCGGEIKGGMRKRADGTEIEFTAKQVATGTRTKFGKRYCKECADKVAMEYSAKDSAHKATSPMVAVLKTVAVQKVMDSEEEIDYEVRSKVS
jgi:hypothetical protein